MSDEHQNEDFDPDNIPPTINLDDLKAESTGDPLIDRGMDLTLDKMEEAVKDPEHPDHAAAKAASAHISDQMGRFVKNIYGDQFRRIGENLTASIKPNLGNLFSAPRVESLRAAVEPVHPPTRYVPQLPDVQDWEVDETPQMTLEALLEVSERMSEMVRVSAEHRDVAVRQMMHFKAEAEASRKSERRMYWLTWLALIGTWGAVVVAVLAL